MANYARLLVGASGRAVEVGCGPGQLFVHYPASVSSLLAVEINPTLLAMAIKAAARVSVAVEVVEGNKHGAIPVPDQSADVVVCCEVLCSAAEPRQLLAEIRRILRPGGELRIYEHTVATRRVGSLAQRAVDLLGWPRLLGGCHVARDIVGTVTRCGFVWVDCERLWCAGVPLTWPTGPHVLGTALRA
jgi:SAM-dependent methyltransferase